MCAGMEHEIARTEIHMAFRWENLKGKTTTSRQRRGLAVNTKIYIDKIE